MSRIVRPYHSFFDSTVTVDMSSIYEKFTKLVPVGATVLDLGCGAGRDAKYFHDIGYRVEAIDGSKRLVEKARKYTGLDVQCADFFSISEEGKYDAIWACASLLHVGALELPNLSIQLIRSLKEGGLMYCSFKYGIGQREVDGRVFTDLNEEALRCLFGEVGGCFIEEVWVTEDNRPDRNEKWLNCLLRKASD